MLTGAGKAAGEYSKQMRQIQHENEMQLLSQAHDTLMRTPVGSQQYAMGLKAMADFGSKVHGDPNKAVSGRRLYDWVYAHPDNVAAGNEYQQLMQPAPPQKVPGPALPGETPGIGTLAQMISRPIEDVQSTFMPSVDPEAEMQMPSPVLGQPQNPWARLIAQTGQQPVQAQAPPRQQQAPPPVVAPTAQPKTNPVQPQAQTGPTGDPGEQPQTQMPQQSVANKLQAWGGQQEAPLSPDVVARQRAWGAQQQQPIQMLPQQGQSQSPMGVYQSVYPELAAGGVGFIPPATAALRQHTLEPFVSNTAELQRQLGLARGERQIARETYEAMKQSPEFASMPDWMKSVAMMEGFGFKSPVGMGGMLSPIKETGVQVQSLPPDVIAKFNLGNLPPKTPLIVERDKGGDISRVYQQSTSDQLHPGVDGRMVSYNPKTGQTEGGVPGLMQPEYSRPLKVNTDTGRVGLITPMQAMSGSKPMDIPGTVNPGMLSTFSETPHSFTVPDGYGNPTQVVQNLRSVRGKVLPGQEGGAGAAAGQTVIGQKTLTPLQATNQAVDVKTLDQTIDRFKGIMQRIPMLQSLLASQKIQFNMDPNSGAFNWRDLVKRTVPLTDEEAKLTADFAAAMEDINKLRQPLGNAGFRGPEAFMALIAQAGRPGANPKVTEETLKNTIQMLNVIRAEKAKPLGKRVEQSQPESGAGAGASTGAGAGSKFGDLLNKYNIK
jgi:hypothetical protein